MPKSAEYNLTIQFSLDDADITRFRTICRLESDLIDFLAPAADVDGHDAGSGEMNIFILTKNPSSTFARAKLLIDMTPELGAYRAGYRNIDEDDYTPLWPEGLESFDVK